MSQLNLKIELRAFDHVSKQFENISKSAGKLGKAFDKNLTELKHLDTQMKLVSSFRKREQALSKMANDIDKAKNKAREFKQLLKQAQAENAGIKQLEKLSKQYKKASENASKLIGKHKALKGDLGQASAKLREAGISTKNLATAENLLKQRALALNGVLDAQANKLQKLKDRQNQLNKAKQQFSQSMQRGQNMAVTGYAGMATGQKVLGGVAGMVQPGIAFGEQMSAVQAKLRLEKDSAAFKAIRAQALDLGSTTSFSASEVGAGQEFLAMAGFDANAIRASMGDILNLAKASNTELAVTADIASNVAGAFKIDPAVEGNITHLADVLAMTTTTANVDMQMLGDSMKYLAQASDLNLGVEQAAAMAGMLGNVGIQGTQAGTTLRAMLNRVSAPAKAGREAMEALGLDVKTTGDNAKDFVNILEQLAAKTEGMGNLKRAAYLKEIFGAEAVSGMTELVNQAGAGQLKKYIEIIEKSDGTAKKMADIMSDNIAGDIKSLASAWEGLNIAITGTKTGMIRELVQSLTGVIRQVTAWVKANPELAGTILTVVTALGALLAVSGGLLITVGGLVGPFAMLRLTFKMLGIQSGVLAGKGGLLARAFKKLGGAGKWLGRIIVWLGRLFLTNPIGLAVAGIATAAYLIYKNWDGIKAYFSDLWNSIKYGANMAVDALKAKWSGIKAYFSDLWNSIKYGAGMAVSALKAKWSGIKTYFSDLWNSIAYGANMAWTGIKNAVLTSAPIQWFKQAWSGVTAWFSETWTLLQTDTLAGLARIGEAILSFSPITIFRQIFQAVLDYFGIELPESYFASFLNIGGRIKEAIFSWAPVQWLQGVFAGAFEWINGKLNALVNSFIAIKNKITGFFSSADAQMQSLSKKQQARLNKMGQQSSAKIMGNTHRQAMKMASRKPLAARSKRSKHTTINNHINVKGGGSPRQVAHHVKRAVSNRAMYDAVA